MAIQDIKNFLAKIPKSVNIIWVRQVVGIYLIFDTGHKYLSQPNVAGSVRWEPDVSWLVFLAALVGLEITHHYFNEDTPTPTLKTKGK